MVPHVGALSFVGAVSQTLPSALAYYTYTTCSNKKLLGAPGLTTRNKDATNGALGLTTMATRTLRTGLLVLLLGKRMLPDLLGLDLARCSGSE